MRFCKSAYARFSGFPRLVWGDGPQSLTHSLLRKDIQGAKDIISLSDTAWVSAENVHSGEGTLLSYSLIFLTGSLEPFSHIPLNVPVPCHPATSWAETPKVVWGSGVSMLPTAPTFFSHNPPPSSTPQRVYSESHHQSKVKLCCIQAFSRCALLHLSRIMHVCVLTHPKICRRKYLGLTSELQCENTAPHRCILLFIWGYPKEPCFYTCNIILQFFILIRRNIIKTGEREEPKSLPVR